MATVNKDFKIKSGLIVEGTTGTINGQDILTKKQADQDYIIGLIGGAADSAATPDTVVLRDGDANFAANNVTVNTLYVGGSTNNGIDVVDGDTEVGSNNGILLSASSDIALNSSNGDIVLNPDGSAYYGGKSSNNEIATRGYVDGEISSLDTAAQGYADAAETAANGYTDSAISTEVTNRNSAISTAKGEAIDSAEGYTDSAISTEVTNRNSAISTAKGEAISDANDYTDSAISTEVDNRDSAISTAIYNLNLAGTYDALGAASTALQDAKDYTDQEVAALVGTAPDILDTLGELATALQENPDIISDLQDIAAGKQDTLTAGNGIVIDENLIYVPTFLGSGVSITPTAVEIDRAVVDDWYDASGAATTAQQNAEGYADGVASDAVDSANSYTDSSISTEVTNRNSAISDAISTEVSDRNGAISDAISTEVSDRNSAITSAVNALTTSDIEEGSNQYFTDARAKSSAADLLTGATKTNITITGTGAGLTITAENGVGDSTTDDLDEGTTNKYFTDARARTAVDGTTRSFTAVEVNSVAKQVAATVSCPVAGINQAYGFDPESYRSAEFLVKVAYGNHTEISKVLLTLDINDNIAMTEYGIVGTNGSASSISADISGGEVRLLATTSNNNSTVTVMGTLLV